MKIIHFTFTLLISLFLGFGFISCEQDPDCETSPILLGEIPLAPTSIDHFPVFFHPSPTYFDSMGNKIEFRNFEVIESGDTIFPYHGFSHFGVSRPCPEDPSVFRSVRWEPENYVYSLIQETPSLGFYFEVRLIVKILNYSRDRKRDQISVSKFIINDGGGATSWGPESVKVVVDWRDLSDNPISNWESPFFDSLTFNGKTFYDVYGNESSEVYYNLDQGIIAFRDTTGIMWTQ